MEKLHEYQGFYGRIHYVKDQVKDKLEQWKENHPEGVGGIARNSARSVFRLKDLPAPEEATLDDDFSHIFRRKTRKELVRISAAVMGIEFSYAAETAFVSPTLLKIGVRHQHMTLVWALSPVLGFFVTPVLGSVSDGCRLAYGRRRPFILILALGVLCGLALVPNGEALGYVLGDSTPSTNQTSRRTPSSLINYSFKTPNNSTDFSFPESQSTRSWGIFFTVLGTVLLDFDADSCQSPARAYLLDVTVPEDHAKGLSTFTVMAGFGGFCGYALGGIDWDATIVGKYLGGQVRAVFTFITVIFVACVLATVTAFREIPLKLLEKNKENFNQKVYLASWELERKNILVAEGETYGTVDERFSGKSIEVEPTVFRRDKELMPENSLKMETETPSNIPSMKEYLKSIIFMPKSLRMICLTNFFCWMSHVCYSLYFTDFVGEAVYEGDPSAASGSRAYERYQEGVRYGCWGMSMYSLSCSCYSLVIESLIKRFRAKTVYVGGLLFYSTGMSLMALTKNKFGVILFSWAAGVMYSTLFTMPYLLVAHYHSLGVFGLTKEGETKQEQRLRGLGTDVAIISSMVFLAQFILALCMGSIVIWAQTTTAVVTVASLLAFCGAISALKITYLDL